MQELISALFDKWYGKPILVIGGGPSVTKDLEQLKETPACVISANDHGFHQSKFPVDLVVSVDRVHLFLKQDMEKLLRPYGKPIVNKHATADYRLPDWDFIGSCGTVAVVVAAALGGYPVMATGLDMWRDGRLYFHPTPGQAPSPRRRQQAAEFSRDEKKHKVNPLKKALGGSVFRPLSGPLCMAFPQYDPTEILPEQTVSPYREKLLKIQPQRVEVVKRFSLLHQDSIREGTNVVLSPKEAKMHYGRWKLAK